MHPTIRVLALSLCLTLLAACGVTKPSRFYILTPMDESGAASTAQSGPAIGIGMIDMPKYLDRPEIARRTGDNQIKFASSDRWAEPLKVNVPRVLSENLATQIPTDRVALFPWSRATSIDYQVIVSITSFEADTVGTVTLTTAWKVLRHEDESVITQKRTSYTEVAADAEFTTIVATQSRLLAALSRDIAAAIKTAAPVNR